MTQTLSPDAAAEQAIRGHHAVLSAELDELAAAVLTAAEQGRDTEPSRAALVQWLNDELLPHATAEEGTLYRAAGERAWGAALVDGMLREHRAILAAVDRLRGARGVAAAATAEAVRALFAVHLEKENELIVPPLVADPSVALAELLEGMHALLGGEEDHGADAAETGARASGGCGCGGCGGHGGSAGEESGLGNLRLDDRLDVRALAPAQRHETIFARLAGLQRKEALIIINDHDPVPLHYQLEAEQPGRFSWDYLEAGPQTWQVRVERLGA